MDNYIKISDFAKLTNSTIKTVMYYHKIGLLQQPKRSQSGYRLYGANELARMRMIKHLKSFGLDLKEIKEILGDSHASRTLKQVLQSLHVELTNEKKNIENQISKVEKLLSQEIISIKEDTFDSESFQIITEILKPEQVQDYKQTCPELYEQQNKIMGIIESFKWGENYQDKFSALAEYFKDNPNHYRTALEFGKRLANLSQLSENDPRIELLARESAEFIKSVPFLKEMLFDKSGFGKPYEGLYGNIIGNILSPAQLKHKQLIEKYLNYKP
ncbi:MAG: MerR family transcriptional regulator [Bacillota bacterium]|nr:MerR family transcriptional regulator [Bacillota bacterium]